MSTPSKSPLERRQRRSALIFEIALFPMLAAMMFASKLLMEVLPNIHLLGMFVMLLTVVFRVRALIPIYIYVFIQGLYAGFNMWWIPYLYIWTLLWGITMLIPRNISPKAACAVYPIVCALHGFAYGTLYAPAQALMFNMDLEQTLAWIISGIPFDIIHGISNFACGLLIYPLSQLIWRLLRRTPYRYAYKERNKERTAE